MRPPRAEGIGKDRGRELTKDFLNFVEPKPGCRSLA